MDTATREICERLTANVVRILHRRGWTQKRAAEACGMDFTMFNRVIGGKYTPHVKTLVRLATGLKVDPASLIRKPPQRKSKPQKPR